MLQRSMNAAALAPPEHPHETAAMIPMIRCGKTAAAIDQGAEMRPAFMSIETVSTYSEGMTHGTENAELGDPGACRRR